MRTKVTREAIVTEALALLDEQGLDAVSLRTLAGRLDVRAPTLYGHIASKAALYSMMGERILRRCVEGVEPSVTWQDWLRNFGRAFWRVQSATRDAARLIMVARIEDAALEDIIGAIVGALTDRGMPPLEARRAQGSIQSLVTGWIAFTQGHNGDTLRATVPVPQVVYDSIDVLVTGWTEYHGSRATGPQPG